jgi:hypothetical protein
MSESNTKSPPGLRLKARWRKEGRGMSLKKFARKLVSEGDQLAKDWLEVKSGALNDSRSDKNKQRISAEKQASKQASRK